MQVTKERAEEVDDAWKKASRTERLRLPRIEWYAWGDGDTQYFETKPSVLETAAADRIVELEAALRAIVSAVGDPEGMPDAKLDLVRHKAAVALGLETE